MKLRLLGGILLILAIFGLGWTAASFYQRKTELSSVTKAQDDPHTTFLIEVYDKIKENYWDKISDERLGGLFQLGIEKLTGQIQTGKIGQKKDFEKTLNQVLKEIDPGKKKEFSASLADMVLANLAPSGRSRLYTQKEEKNLAENVKNINPEVNQYEALGINKDASAAAIEKAYQEKTNELRKERSEETRQKLAQIERARQILANPETRQVYDQSGIEPTMDYRLLLPDILYLHLTKFSPTSFDELKRVTEKFDKEGGPTCLIFDLRDNIGGSIDLAPYFLGPFIGLDRYAYQFFRQGERIDFKTKIDWLPSLVRYKTVVILINAGTQSTAELVAATLKKYNVGVLVGTPTKGWGTVEKVFPLDHQLSQSEKFSIFLVHSLALRDDGQPIEGNGVQPVVNIADPDWAQQLYQYLHYDALIEAIKNLFT
ncbi:hypothetical protein FJZ40_00500 [Candidatus Shapirobacteria bacterium]|nr:hypothetical protein [Candidatus Shapirobacteria bacterium]